MRLRVDSEEAGLKSHRGWVFQNFTYLLDPEGKIVDHAGLETTMQSQREIGQAFFIYRMTRSAAIPGAIVPLRQS